MVDTNKRYEVLNKIGEGSFGDVYLAKDTHLDRKVAIKKISYSADALEEAKMLEKTSCEGIPQIYDLIVNEEHIEIIMEYVDGISLREFIDKNCPLDEVSAVEMIKKIAAIIGRLHDMTPSVIYRDLKPENIIVKSDRSVRLIDFGAAFSRDYSGEDGINGFGTKGYSAPELWHGVKAQKESDVYSIGVILVELLTGVSPYNDTIIKRPLREYNRGLSIGLERICAICLNEKLSLRYTKINDLLKDLDNYHAKERSEHMKMIIKKLIVVTGYMLGVAVALRIMYENNNLKCTPTIAVLLCLCAVCPMLLHYILLYQSMKNKGVSVCKEIYLSSKKGYGLFTGIVFLSGIILGALIYDNTNNEVYANDTAQRMWVDMKDENERKLLVRDEGVYEVNDRVRLEIPAENIPDNEATLRVIVTGDDGTNYISRNFKIKSTKTN